MRDMQDTREHGFTLIELMVVTAVIGILASVAMPNLLSSRLASNESAVIATMRAIATAQVQFVGNTQLDADRNGVAEYGTLGELGAIDPLRDGSAPIARHLLSASVAAVDASGFASKHGYLFAMYLPDASGAGVLGVPANAASIDPTMAQSFWTCVAWPALVGQSGNRTFFVNTQGLLLQTRDGNYSGAGSVPPAGAALVGGAATQINQATVAADTIGADGNRWTAVR